MPVRKDFDLRPSPLVVWLDAAVIAAVITFYIVFWQAERRKVCTGSQAGRSRHGLRLCLYGRKKNSSILIKVNAVVKCADNVKPALHVRQIQELFDFPTHW
jgi:hypothetical protein